MADVEAPVVRKVASASRSKRKGPRWMELAIPKESKRDWWTSFEPNLVWGNQEPLWPIKPAALTANPTPRIKELALSKTDYSFPKAFIYFNMENACWHSADFVGSSIIDTIDYASIKGKAKLKTGRLSHPTVMAMGGVDSWYPPQLNGIKTSPEYVYSCGRVSQIWKTSAPALQATPSQRLLHLARHKSESSRYVAQHIPHFQYGCGRVSTIWETPYGAMTCPDRPRTARLAQPRKPHPDYMPSRPPQSIVTDAAKCYTITPYLDGLAKPKDHVEGPFRESEWVVADGAKQAIPSERTAELARHKKPAEGYQPSRSAMWKVGVGALNAVPSNRMEELSKPIIRDTMDSVQFNPGVFNVSEAAKKAKASSRIEELAEPIRR